jgi:D-alanyl-lipoteichoic acid acyltransferase DltB (MBOAT superfamily)
MLFNYTIGSSLAKNSKSIYKKKILTVGIIANLSLLGYFKYADFFIENLNSMSSSDIGLLHLALPLAISFFTFQQIQIKILEKDLL